MFLQDLPGKGWGTTLKSRFPKYTTEVSERNEKFPQKLGPILFTQCKVSADPSEAKCRGYLKDWAGRKTTRLHHLQHHFPPKSLFCVLVPKDNHVLGN